MRSYFLVMATRRCKLYCRRFVYHYCFHMQGEMKMRTVRISEILAVSPPIRADIVLGKKAH
jgi:hypothetical protein